MKVVVDTNIVFSALLNTDSVIGTILLNPQGKFHFIAPGYLLEETLSLQEKLLKLTGYSSKELLELEFILFGQISFQAERLIPKIIWDEAYKMVKGVDEKDIAFVALALFQEAFLWTGDKKLKEGLQATGFDKLVTTQALNQIRLGG